MTGWPTSKTDVDPLVRPYYTLKDELSVADGIVYKGQRSSHSKLNETSYA